MVQGAPNVQTRLQIFEVIDRLEALTASATKLPLTRRAVINPADVQDLVTRLRHLLPREIVEAQQVLRYKDSLVQRAQAEARRMREAAEQEVAHRVSETQIMHGARLQSEELRRDSEKKAQELLTKAEAHARERTEGADAYATDVLRKLEDELMALLSSARRGLEVLGAGPAGDQDQREGEPSGRSQKRERPARPQARPADRRHEGRKK